jgi:hypothetical protein
MLTYSRKPAGSSIPHNSQLSSHLRFSHCTLAKLLFPIAKFGSRSYHGLLDTYSSWTKVYVISRNHQNIYKNRNILIPHKTTRYYYFYKIFDYVIVTLHIHNSIYFILH